MDVTTSQRKMLSKVPLVTLTFWFIKIMATTVGETSADLLNVNVQASRTQGNPPESTDWESAAPRVDSGRRRSSYSDRAVLCFHPDRPCPPAPFDSSA